MKTLHVAMANNFLKTCPGPGTYSDWTFYHVGHTLFIC